MSKKRLSGRRALVTGASSGIGAEIAKVLAAEGAGLILVARRRERLEALADQIRAAHGVEVLVEVQDLAEPDAAARLFERTEGEGQAVDVLINNAGFGAFEHFVAIPWERHAAMMQLNMVALTQLSWLYARAMRARKRGNIMNIASIGAYSPSPDFAVYAATKAYVRNFSEALDYELKGSGVRAIVINPGGTHSEFAQVSDQKLKKMGEMAMMDASTCARIAVTKMLRGRRTVVTGFMNAVSMWLLRFLPRAWLPRVTSLVMASAVEKASAVKGGTTEQAAPGQPSA